MITVTLLQAGLGIPFGVDEHPKYMDYELRDDRKTTTSSIVDIAEENAIAPLVARLGGVRAIDSYPELNRAHERLLAKHKNREDGTRVVTMLLSWAVQWPNGVWEITGRNLDVVQARGDYAGIDPTADAPRYSEASISTTNPAARIVGIFDAQGDPLPEIRGETDEGAEITIEMAMKPDITIPRGGGSKSGRVRRDRPMSAAERNRRREAELKEDGLRPMMVSGRVSVEAHEALYSVRDVHGQRVAPGALMEIVGLAIASGRTFEQVAAALAAQERSA